MDIVLNLGILLLIAYIFAFFARKKVPSVLTYILIGLVLGRSIANFIDPTFMQLDSLLSTLVLAFIAFEIGDTFRWNNIKQLGVKSIALSTFEGTLTAIIVSTGLMALFYTGILHVAHPMPVALLLGATAAATAPAATFMVVKERKARGIFTDYLLMAVTFDDAVGIIIFDFCTVIARALLYRGGINMAEAIVAPLQEIGYSVLCGAALGLLLVLICRYIREKEGSLLVSIAMVLLAAGLSNQFGFSPLLSAMVLGAVFANLGKTSKNVFQYVDEWTPPLFLLFFVISGANLDISLLPQVGLIGLAYALLRACGKIFGVNLGATIVKAPPEIRKYLGFAMLPQAGVAIGFAMLIKTMFPELEYITTIVMTIVIIFEIVGPIGTQYALEKSGSIEKGV
ncbi:MAG: cation:proton antiporter [Candidatus Thermoplasmatota archaeon]|nr:cation:proton antiporter [Candidatus Thermoplasmatota archaeon]